MQNIKKLSKTLLVASALSSIAVVASAIPEVAEFSGQNAVAQELGVSSPARAATATAARAARPRITSAAPTRERAGKILMRAQELTTAEPPQYAEAKEYLLKQNVNRWNTTETAGFYQIMSSIAGSESDYDALLDYYKKLLAMDTIPYSLRDQLTYSVGQIEFSQDNQELGISYLYDWLQYQPNPSITQLELFANIHYSVGQEAADGSPAVEKNYRLAIEYVNWAITKAKTDGKNDKENWYQVLRSLHNLLEEIDKVVEYAELLATRWPKKEYWVQLSNLYAMAGAEDNVSESEVISFEKKQLATMELAHRQGMLEAGRELETMSQLYLYHESPYQASKTITKSLVDGLSEKNQRNFELQASAFINGKDMSDAVEPLAAAAELAENGNNYMRLANVYLSLDNYEEAAKAIENALDKGGLRRPDQSSLLQGQAYLALERFDDARSSFREAAKDDRSETMARNMLRYVDSEEQRIKDIKEYLS